MNLVNLPISKKEGVKNEVCRDEKLGDCLHVGIKLNVAHSQGAMGHQSQESSRNAWPELPRLGDEVPSLTIIPLASSYFPLM